MNGDISSIAEEKACQKWMICELKWCEVINKHSIIMSVETCENVTQSDSFVMFDRLSTADTSHFCLLLISFYQFYNINISADIMVFQSKFHQDAVFPLAILRIICDSLM